MRRFLTILVLAWVSLAIVSDGSALAKSRRSSRYSRPTRPPKPVTLPLVTVICYHDLSDAAGQPTYTLPPDSLRTHIRRAKANGWTILPLSEVLAKRWRPEKLPPKVMVLTFDDGYRSFREAALPILREEKVEATLSIVSSFIDNPPPDLPPMLTWDEIRALDHSRDVEIVSHSHALHGYVTSNPWSDTAPTVTTRRFLPAEKRYETRDEYEGRLAADLKESSRRLRAELGHEVSVLAWPYGESNDTARRVATSAGFTTTLGLEGSAVEFASLWAGYVQRIMAYRETAIGDSSVGWFQPSPAPVRAAQLDLDDLYDPRADRLRANVDRAIERLRAIGATDVFLQGLADPSGDGFLQQTYFMNHQTTVRADVWSMMAFRLARERMKPWIRVPSLNLAWEWAFHPEWRVPFPAEAQAGRMVPSYYRVSPDLPEVRKAAADFYTDLAVYLPIRGVIFDDDAYLRADEPLRGDGTTDPARKRDAIRGLLDEVKVAVRAWRPQCRFGRVLSPEVAEQPGTNPDYAQDLAESLRENDLTVISVVARDSADPSDAEVWAERVASSAIANAQAGAAVTQTSATTSAAKPAAMSAKTAAATSATTSAATSAPKEAPRPPSLLFRVEAYDAARDSWLASESLQAVVSGLGRGGALHIGVSPLRPDAGNFPAGLLRGPLSPGVSGASPLLPAAASEGTPLVLPDSSGSISVAR